jgi:Type II secretion system (T2SS), protein G
MKNKPKHSLLFSILIGLTIFVIAVAGVVLYCWNQISIQRFNSTQISIQEVEKALKMYASQHGGKLPDTLDEMLHFENLACTDFAPEVLLDSWGTPFDYQRDGTTFKLRSAGPDLKLNTSDDIINKLNEHPTQ